MVFIFACVWTMAIARRVLKVKVICHGQRSLQKMCVPRKYLLRSHMIDLTAIEVGFHCNVSS